MDRRIVHRGLAALALALVLVLGGAQPAAAEESGFWGLTLDRLLGVWEEDSFVGSFWGTVGSWFSGKAKSDQGYLDAERGFGIDPNGNSVSTTVQPSEPVAPEG